MRSIDVKDLQERTAELLREVREKETLYVVSSGGEPPPGFGARHH